MAKITREKFKTHHTVFDEFTNRNIYKLIRQGYFKGVIGPISIGKESNVFAAAVSDTEKIVLKIHRLETSDFNKMFEYLRYDPRYHTIKKRRRQLIFTWAQREFRNLLRARTAKVKVPKPLGVKNNIVMEEFIGNSEPAKKLKDHVPKNLNSFFKKVVQNMQRLYSAGLVHTDLSAFNILNHHDAPVFIDFSQCTTLQNPNAGDYLKRDIKNVSTFFRKYGLDVDEDNLLKKIVKNS